jgi:RNA polymerase sigma factor (sigma-70 family)
MKHSRRLDLFDRIRAKHFEFLMAILWKLTHDRELFKESLQYALTSIWEHVQQLEGRGARAYIFRIALSANGKAWRNRIGKDKELLFPDPENRATPDESSERKEQFCRINEAMAKLPEQQSRALAMRYLEQDDYRTIAREMGCSEASARSHVSKALASLKSRLKTEV